LGPPKGFRTLSGTGFLDVLRSGHKPELNL
jgi:hypothetical protein